MESGRGTSVRTKVGVLFMLMGLLSGLMATVAAAVDLTPDPTGVNTGGFEIEGDLVSPPDGTTDWVDIPASQLAHVIDDTADSGVKGQENEPENYKCNVGGNAPPKDDYQRIYGRARIGVGVEPFLDLAYRRDKSEGNTHLNFEFNRLSTAGYGFPAGIDTPAEIASYVGDCPFLNRSVDDLLIAYDYGGGDDPAVVNVYEWDGDNWVLVPDADLPDPLGGAATTPGDAVGVSDPIAGDTFDGRKFGEFSLNLEILDELVGGGVLGCPGFATMQVRSRSSGESFSSNLQDRLATIPFNLSNCAKVKIKKVDDSSPPVATAGAVYGLYDTLAKAQAVAGQTDAQAIAAAVSTCTTIANGTCELVNADPEKDYWITEITPPAGLLPSTEIRAVTAAQLLPFGTLDLSGTPFVNNRPVGDVTITKNLEDADGNPIDLTEANVDDYDDFLVGAQFDLQQGNPLATADDADGDPLTCTIAASDINLTTNSASCVLDDVLYGDYTVHETAPQGTTPETNDQEVTVGDESVHVTVSFTNIINPDTVVLKSTTTPVVNAGDQVSFSLTVSNEGDAPALGVVLTDSLNTTITGWASSQPNPPCVIASNTLTCNVGTIDPGGEFSVTLTGTSTAASCPSITNQASVSSTNETEADAANNNSDVVTVTVNCPDVRVSKSTSTPSVNAGDPVAYSVVITNDGPGVATAVSFTDDLPDGVVWSFNGAPPAGCSLNGSNNLVCSFATMAVGSVTVNLQGTTDAADCPSITNPVSSVSASNEPSGVTGNNSTSAVTITVNCPDVDLAKVADDDVVSAGDPVGFTITVVNDGDGVATNVTVSDTLPAIAGYTWDFDDVVSDETDPCSLVGLALSCDFGDLSPEESASVHVFATLDEQAVAERACGDYENTGTVLFDNGSESDLSNNTDAVEILCPNVNLGKVADAAIVDAGDQIGFTITVSNIDDGEPPAEGTADVAVTDDLPGDLAWTVADDSDLEGGTCVILLGTLTCTWADLPAIDAEDAPQISVHVVADTTEADCGVYDNTASAVVANGVDPDDASASSRVRCPISIQLEKTGDALAHVGDVVDYQFTATNTGGEDLLNVELTDPECNVGSILLVDDADGDTVLAAGTWDAELEAFVGGEVWRYTCERTLTADDVVVIDGNDFALNTGSIRGEDADGREATDTDPHVVEIITPVIQVVKTVDDDTPAVGQTVTFTYVVTNTGDTTLFNVAVVDDQLGAIGTIPELAAGASTNLTKTMVVAATSPTRNIATATGADVLGKSVTDDDDATITIVLGEVITPPVVQPAVLVKTGADSSRLLILAGMLLLLGGLLVAADGGGAPIMVARRRHS